MGSEGSAVTVRRAVARVAARMRAAVGLHALVHALLAGLVSGAMIVAIHRLGWIGRDAALLLGAATLAGASAYVGLRARAVAPLHAAALADRRLGLADRLTSAVSFLDEPGRSALMEAAIADAATAAASVDPRRVLAYELPRGSWLLAPALVALLLALYVRPPAPVVVHSPPPPKPRLIVDQDALVAEREALRRLARESRGKDAQLTELAQNLDELLAAIDQKELSRAEAFARLAALEEKLAPPSGPLTKASEQLAPMTKALATEQQTKKLAEAIKHDDLAAAKAELDRLAAAAEERAKREGGSEDSADRELQRALDRASRALDEARKKEDAERDKRQKELEEEQRKLEREKRERPDDEEVERRLQRNKRELERLERERQQAAEQRRNLERLSREMQQAAEQLRQKMSPEAMKRAAEQLAKMEDEIRKLGSGARAQMQIAELKEVLRRSGRVESGAGGQGGQQEAQVKGQGKAKGEGQSDGKGGKGDRLAAFDERAGGQPNALLLGGDDPGQGQVLLPLPSGQGQGPSPSGQGDQPSPSPSGPGGDEKGDRAGDGHDPNLLGDRSGLKTNKKQIRASGQKGQGPSRSQTILGASERGFSSRDYKAAYKDYAAAVEEVMSQEGVPPGYRYYVKRYFQLIRPRE